MTTANLRIFRGPHEIGVVRTFQTTAAPRVALVEIDPAVLTEPPPEKNPNSMSENDFKGLVNSVEKLDFSQTPAIWFPTWRREEDRVIIDTARIIDGTHRARAAKLLSLHLIPANWYRELRAGEESVMRIALNRHRGTLNTDIEKVLLREAVNEYGWNTADLEVTGYSQTRIDAILQEITGAPPPAVDLLPDIGAFLPEPDTEAAKNDGGGLLEIKTRDGDETKVLRALLNKAARAGKCKGSFKLADALFHMGKLAGLTE